MYFVSKFLFHSTANNLEIRNRTQVILPISSLLIGAQIYEYTIDEIKFEILNEIKFEILPEARHRDRTVLQCRNKCVF